MPKRSEPSGDATDSMPIPIKKARVTNDHSTECQDPECEGCDEGQVEISFIRGEEGDSVQPTAEELLTMAKEEQGDTEMARRLFDLALEAFDERDGKTGFGYAQCLVELGRALTVEESIREGHGLFVALSKKKEDNDDASKKVDLSLWQARAALAMARSIRQQKTKAFDELRQDLEDSEGEIEDEVALDELMVKDQVAKEELGFYKEAIDILDKVLLNFDTLDEKPLELTRQAMHDIREYMELLEQPSHEDHVTLLFDTLIRYIQLFSYENDDILLTLWGACLLHRQKFCLGKQKEQMCQDAEKHIQKAKEIYSSKYKKESPLGWELYAMLKMTQSNMADDEDQVLELYDESIQAYKKALELDPDNEKLQEMLELLDGSAEDEEDD
ncbi:hypothetical protein BCR42DRAFT_416978, partial [Absidia repens]